MRAIGSHAHALAAVAGATVVLVAGLVASSPASALTLKECSAKYKEAKAAGAGKTVAWNDFRKAECAAPSNAERATTEASAAARSTAAPTAVAPAGSAAGAAAVFPTAVSEKFSSETPAQARLKTCSEQYNANKPIDANGGLRWIQKGGGYWSECAKHLKG